MHSAHMASSAFSTFLFATWFGHVVFASFLTPVSVTKRCTVRTLLLHIFVMVIMLHVHFFHMCFVALIAAAT